LIDYVGLEFLGFVGEEGEGGGFEGDDAGDLGDEVAVVKDSFLTDNIVRVDVL